MFQRLKISLSKPALIFAYIKDKSWQIIKHLLLMTFLMTIPALIASISEPSMLFPSAQTLMQGVKKEFTNANFSIEDNVLINPDEITKSFFIDEYIIVIGEGVPNLSGVVVHFKSEAIEVYMKVGSIANQQYKSISYSETSLNNIEFNSSNTNIIANAITHVLSKQPLLISAKVFQIFISNIVRYLFIALFLTLMFRMINRLPLPFKSSFKVSMYLTSIWALTTLILTLFNLQHLSFIALLAAYINHIRAYRSVKLVRRVDGGKKDD